MITAETKRNIARIIPYGIIWFVFSIVYTLLEKALLGPLSYYPSTGNPYSFGIALLVTPVTALITGLLMGILEIRYMNKRFRLLSFSKKILYKSIVYLVIIICFLVAVVAVAYSLLLGHSVVSAQVWTRGIIRKEIVFTGDVLNTTARIQGLCNACQRTIIPVSPKVEFCCLQTSFFNYFIHKRLPAIFKDLREPFVDKALVHYCCI